MGHVGRFVVVEICRTLGAIGPPRANSLGGSVRRRANGFERCAAYRRTVRDLLWCTTAPEHRRLVDGTTRCKPSATHTLRGVRSGQEVAQDRVEWCRLENMCVCRYMRRPRCIEPPPGGGMRRRTPQHGMHTQSPPRTGEQRSDTPLPPRDTEGLGAHGALRLRSVARRLGLPVRLGVIRRGPARPGRRRVGGRARTGVAPLLLCHRPGQKYFVDSMGFAGPGVTCGRSGGRWGREALGCVCRSEVGALRVFARVAKRASQGVVVKRAREAGGRLDSPSFDSPLDCPIRSQKDGRSGTRPTGPSIRRFSTSASQF